MVLGARVALVVRGQDSQPTLTGYARVARRPRPQLIQRDVALHPAERLSAMNGSTPSSYEPSTCGAAELRNTCTCDLCRETLTARTSERVASTQKQGDPPALGDSKQPRWEATLLFSDISGYSKFTEEQDVELVSAVLDHFKQSATRIVQANGGFVNQFVGDEVLAIFGVPTGEQDAPQRAINAALQLHELARTAALCPEQRGLGKQRLLLHSGIDAGVVLVQRRDSRSGLFELTGGAVNRAARLRAMARADEIIVSQRVYARVSPFFHGDPLPQQRIKGIAEVTTPSRILGRRETAPVHMPRSSGFAARSEIEQLLGFIAHAKELDETKLCIVLGSAGSGKTRLLQKLAPHLRSAGFKVASLVGRKDACEPFATLHPVVQRLHAPTPLAFDADNVDAVCSRIARDDERCAILIDDMQWIDPSSQIVLTQLVQRLSIGGHLFVLAARNTLHAQVALTHFQGLLPPAQSVAVELGILNVHDASALVGSYLGIDPRSAPTLVEQLTSLTDGTPLSLLGLLDSLLRDQLLRAGTGSWQLSNDSNDRLPQGGNAQALFECLIASLAPETRLVLRIAAITRSHIEPKLLARVTSLPLERVQAALDDALVARLLRLDTDGAQCFAHDIVWEVLLRDMPAESQRSVHQIVASAMQESPEQSDGYTFALAHHYASGVIERDPSAAFHALCSAAELALRRCDDFLARTLLGAAENASRIGRLETGAGFYAQLAETCLRVGKFDEALRHFDVAIDCMEIRAERACLRGRMAWIYHYQGDQLRPLQLLETALAEVGSPVPPSDLRFLSSAVLLLPLMRAQGGASIQGTPRDIEIRCALYRDYFRVSMECDQPMRAYAAALALARLAPLLPPSRVHAQCEALAGLCFSALKVQARGRQRLDQAFAIARLIDDPVATAYCHQIAHVEAAWRGDFEASETHAKACVDERGQYMELGELCLMCLSMHAFEVARGRNRHALEWAQRAIDRILRIGHAPAVFTAVEGAACATLVSMGQMEAAERLHSQLANIEYPELVRTGPGFLRLSFIHRMQEMLARQSSDTSIEPLLEEFVAVVRHPARAHRVLALCYLFVAHARVHQCLRANGPARTLLLPKLLSAIKDLQDCAYSPYVEAHLHVLRAAYDYLRGRLRTAERLLAEAKRRAQELGMAWVSFTAERIHAHLLRDAGKYVQAIDHARSAEMLAEKYEQNAHLRAIREEFRLGNPPR